MSDMLKYVNIINEAVKEEKQPMVESTDESTKASVGDTVQHKNGSAKIVKVFDDGYMIKFKDDGSTLEVEFDEVELQD